jgi:small-conductance mechanosensitive channel
VSDHIEINSVELIVEHISLLYTVFRRVDSNRSVQIPNIINNNNWIENITRSQVMKEHFKLDVSAGTKFEDIEALTRELRDFVSLAENKRDFMSDVKIQIVDVGDMSKIELRINVGHKVSLCLYSVRIGLGIHECVV